MGALKDLTGQKFGRWTVLKHVPHKRRLRWLCKCNCGTIKEVNQQSLLSKTSVSCGCYKTDTCTKHGGSYTRLYRIWTSIKERCYRQKHMNYHNYGGRGIKMCQEWLGSFETFRDWALTHGYQEHLTIDRKDNDGNYTPEIVDGQQ